ncbi:sugar kinase [Desmospora activa]|nr:sugar kinase [Desmospora activa]
MAVITFGESMVLMDPERSGRLENVSRFEKRIAGAESNVSIALSRLGHRVSWISRLGKDPFGLGIYRGLRGEGVDVSGVIFDETRPTGLYFKERKAHGATGVYYYRAGSAASALTTADLNGETWQGAQILFVTGITPALSESCREAVFAAVDTARQQGMTVVFDPNYRGKLWGGKEARSVMRQIAAKADVVLPGVGEGVLMTGSEEPAAIAFALRSLGAKQVVVKLGPEGAWYATSEDEGKVQGFSVQQVDEVGAGDAFAAGYLSGMLDGLTVAESVKRACAMGALAVTGTGDYENLPDREELERFISGASEETRR